ncbi:MAG: putative transposase [Methanosaeta sp. PtaU1.Bin028]|nr:MAG: putative transposase [Methanosaeta sp. PtaU1.Bin028]
MNTAYKFRMYPTKQQEAQLYLTLETCRHLYNLALADRKNAYEVEGISRSYEDQAGMLTAEKKEGNFKGVFSQVLQDVLRRLDKSFKAFFRRVKAGEKPGYPRFKGQGWYKSFTYPQVGFKLDGLKLTLSKIGSIRIFKHREVEGRIKTCTIKKDHLGRWYAILVTEIEDVSQIEPKTAIGVDVGLKSLVALSTGKTIQYPKYYIKDETKLAVAQRDLSRKKKGSSNRRKAKIKVARLHQKIQNHRDEFLHQVSSKIVDSADLIVFENLNISGMLKNHHLAKHIQDHAWGRLIQFTQSKAAKAGKVVELVDARYTSQKCSQCGIMVPKTLADRTHLCPNCGLEMDRDVNAALNIVTLGLRGRACREIGTPTQ